MRLLRSVRFWLGICFIIALITLRFSGLHNYVTLSMFQEKRLQLIALVEHHYLGSVLAYITIYILIVVCAIPLAGVGTVLGGFLFGVIPGVIFANIGATVGATIFFLIVRYAFGNTLQERYKHKLSTFNERIKSYGVFYLVLFRFIIAVPFFIENLLLGLTKIPVGTFIWTTSLGILPGSVVYAFAGRQFATMTSIKDVFTLPIFIAFALLALLAIIPFAVRWYWHIKGEL